MQDFDHARDAPFEQLLAEHKRRETRDGFCGYEGNDGVWLRGQCNDRVKNIESYEV